MSEERALIGVEAIAKFYCWSISKTKKELPKMKQAGVVKRILVGRGHKRAIRIIALKSLLERYWIECIENH